MRDFSDVFKKALVYKLLLYRNDIGVKIFFAFKNFFRVDFYLSL